MPNDEAIHDGRIDLATEVDVTSNAARFYSALHRFAVSLTRNDLTRRIWRNKRFSFWLSDYIKSATSLRSSAGCLRRFIGSSYIKSAAEESISKWSSYLIFTIWRQGNRSLGDPLDGRIVVDALLRVDELRHIVKGRSGGKELEFIEQLRAYTLYLGL